MYMTLGSALSSHGDEVHHVVLWTHFSVKFSLVSFGWRLLLQLGVLLELIPIRHSTKSGHRVGVQPLSPRL